jgi:hypothetical protein
LPFLEGRQIGTIGPVRASSSCFCNTRDLLFSRCRGYGYAYW